MNYHMPNFRVNVGKYEYNCVPLLERSAIPEIFRKFSEINIMSEGLLMFLWDIEREH